MARRNFYHSFSANVNNSTASVMITDQWNVENPFPTTEFHATASLTREIHMQRGFLV